MKRTALVAALLVTGAVILSACGGSDSHDGMSGSSMDGDSGSMHGGSGDMHGDSGDVSNRSVLPGATEIAIRADSLTFEPKRLQLTAGQAVTIVLTSVDVEHDFTVQEIGHIVHAPAEHTVKGGLVIDKPGTYRFWCSVRGHREGGMEGVVTVTA